MAQFQVAVGREPHEKRETLRRLLRDAKDLQNAIIFCNRKREVALLHKSLQKHGFSVGALHGDMDQSARTAALDQFRKGEIPLLVASDVAARGLDIPATSHVFNFDVPHHADDYVHRIGRTGRAGRAGTAISIVTPLDHKSIAAIEKLIGQTIPRAEGGVRGQSTVRTLQRRSRPPRHRADAKAARVAEREKAHEKAHAAAASRAGNANPGAPAAAAIPARSRRHRWRRSPRRSAPAASRTPSIGRAEAPPGPARYGLGARRSLASSGVPAAAGSRPGLSAQVSQLRRKAAGTRLPVVHSPPLT